MLNQSVIDMLGNYELKSVQDHENALKEIIQEIALLGLWRAKFFEKGLFYGGSALRILYKLDRFSEDLDLSLIKPDPDFTIRPFLTYIKKELKSFGFEVSIEHKTNKKKSQIDAAFIKTDTLRHLIKIDPGLKTHRNAKLKIKLEIDREPPPGFSTEVKYNLTPVPFFIKTMSLSDLFAGKMHAALCRKGVLNIKGRDWYDLIWFLKNKVKLNAHYLTERMYQTGHINKKIQLDKKKILDLISRKAEKINFEEAKKDLLPFLKKQNSIDSLALWSKDFFCSVFDNSLEMVS
ncbi:MAG TPA: nucleotidyl transferase AbiEii/AbiGii toxin family protein [Spirochaetota bacterium]|nr:nucleotidyl transferase AbiEii/AbiGii toxin family protein [Spirochaetota bacterium]